MNYGDNVTFTITILEHYNAESMKVYANGALIIPSISGNVYTYTVENAKVDLSEEGLIYLTAEEEEGKIIAQGNAPLNDDGTFIRSKVKARQDADYPVVTPGEVEYMDVSPQQIASIAASLIPFLEHDDANRALMGSNMMRQAVPLLRSEAPIVGTGIERQLVRDSRTQLTAEGYGTIEYVDASVIRINYDRTEDEEFVSDEKRSRRATPGSIAFVPSVAGLILAGEVVKDLAET